MKRIIIIHGWSGSPNDNWLPWLKAELEKQGHAVLVPNMSDSNNPVIEKWVSHLAQIVGTPDKETFFVGHSIGCQAILRYLETIDTSVGGAVFVAGWFNLENMESKLEEITAKPWIETAIDFEKIKSILPKSTLIISDNDPYGAFQENKEKFIELGSKIVVLPKAGHITGSQCSEALSEIELMLN